MTVRALFRRSGLVAIAALAAVATAAPGATAASSTVLVSGTFTVTDPGAITCATSGAPFILRCQATGFTTQYSGSLSGTSIVNFSEIINCKTSTTFAIGTETFTGSVAGVGSGSLTWKKSGSADFDCATGELSNFSAHGSISAGTGDLAGLNGNVLFGPDFYSGELH
jgi:hypothetical protein